MILFHSEILPILHWVLGNGYTLSISINEPEIDMKCILDKIHFDGLWSQAAKRQLNTINDYIIQDIIEKLHKITPSDIFVLPNGHFVFKLHTKIILNLTILFNDPTNIGYRLNESDLTKCLPISKLKFTWEDLINATKLIVPQHTIKVAESILFQI